MVTDDRKISLCITNYNRYDLLLESFSQVKDDPRIGEIVISDDHSDDNYYAQLLNIPKTWTSMPLRVYRNDKTEGCYKNKMLAIDRAFNDYCIIFDSDNVIDKRYLDAIYEHDWRPDVLFAPEFAEPIFNYTHLAGKTYSNNNITDIFGTPFYSPFLNCMNYFVNRGEYIRVWQPDIEPYAADTILQNYNWLAAGNSIFVPPGMRYYHRIHEDSHFKHHEKFSKKLHAEIELKIKNGIWS